MWPFKARLSPNRRKFGEDPLGYCASAWPQWALLQQQAGGPVAGHAVPTSEDLQCPVLWLSHARALSAAAEVVLRGDPKFGLVPGELNCICDSQYRAVGLMLVGYGLETALKGMMILRKQFDLSAKGGSGVRHHNLERLAEFVPDLSSKDKAILRSLTRYLEWAGRYPSPLPGREAEVPAFFDTSEQFRIRGMDVIELARRVMGHARVVVEETQR